MSYKTIGMIVTDSAVDRAALAAAAAIAAREDAHLEVSCIGLDPTRYDAMSLGIVPVLVESGAAQAGKDAQDLAKWAATVVPADQAVSYQPLVISNLGLDTVVSRLGRYADLLIASQPYGKGRSPIHVAIVEGELFATGAPVLIIPQEAQSYDDPFQRVLVAWNEGQESMAAVRKSLPILQAAQHVDIVMVDPPSHSQERSDPGGALSLMLARHGVKAEVSILAQTLPRVSDVLLRFAGDKGCNAVVMGAYGHSRFRESILGGATREMLEQTTLPVLMAH